MCVDFEKFTLSKNWLEMNKSLNSKHIYHPNSVNNVMYWNKISWHTSRLPLCYISRWWIWWNPFEGKILHFHNEKRIFRDEESTDKLKYFNGSIKKKCGGKSIKFKWWQFQSRQYSPRNRSEVNGISILRLRCGTRSQIKPLTNYIRVNVVFCLA